MTDDSPRMLWRGGDPAKYTALQAGLNDEDIPFWDAPVYDPSGGFLNSRPYYMEAAPSFEIRVRAADFERASGVLKWIESQEQSTPPPQRFSAPNDDPLVSHPSLPYDWDAREATSEVWSGEDESMAEYLASALRENGIPGDIPDDSSHRVRLCVRPEDVSRARDIVREIMEGRRSE